MECEYCDAIQKITKKDIKIEIITETFEPCILSHIKYKGGFFNRKAYRTGTRSTDKITNLYFDCKLCGKTNKKILSVKTIKEEEIEKELL